jgi:hypothetical protein
MTLTDQEYEENLYYLVCSYLRTNGETDFTQFELMKLSSQLAFISVWGYTDITEPTENQLKELTLADADYERTLAYNIQAALTLLSIPQTERDDLPLTPGCLIFNTDTGTLNICDGSSWASLS